MSSSKEISPPVPPSSLPARSVSLAHLMLWMLATCLALAQKQWRIASGENQDAIFLWYARFHALIYCPIRGAGLAGLMLCLSRKRRVGSAFPAEPGHWFLVIFGAEIAVSAAWEYLNAWIGPPDTLEFLPPWFGFSELIMFSSIVVGLALVAATHNWSSVLWRAAFVAMAINPLSSVLHSWLVTWFTSGAWFMNEVSWSIGSRVLYSLP